MDEDNLIEQDWKGIPKDWETIPIEAYTFMFSQVKDRYEEILSESESVTNKTFTLAGITVAGLSGFAGFKFAKPPDPILFNIVCGFYAANVLCIVKLLQPKEIIQRGTSPKTIFQNYFDDPLYDNENGEKTKLAYYMELRRYQDRINRMNELLPLRQCIYHFLLLSTMLTTVLTAIIILRSAI